MADSIQSVDGTLIYGRARPGEGAWNEFSRRSYQEMAADEPRTKAHTVGPWIVIVASLLLLVFLPEARWGALLPLLGGGLWLLLRTGSQLQTQQTEASERHSSHVRAVRSGAEEPEASQRSWVLGARGEESVGMELEKLGTGYEVSHDLEIIDGSGTIRANIDHLVSGPCGLLVVDAKNWSGELSYTPGGRLTAGPNHPGDQYRAQAPETCRWEASHVQPTPRAVVIAVVGGRVADGGFTLTAEGQLPVYVVEEARLNALIRQLGSAQGTRLAEVDRRSPALRFR